MFWYLFRCHHVNQMIAIFFLNYCHQWKSCHNYYLPLHPQSLQLSRYCPTWHSPLPPVAVEWLQCWISFELVKNYDVGKVDSCQRGVGGSDINGCFPVALLMVGSIDPIYMSDIEFDTFCVLWLWCIFCFEKGVSKIATSYYKINATLSRFKVFTT